MIGYAPITLLKILIGRGERSRPYYMRRKTMSYNEQLNVYEGYVYCVKNIVTNKLYIGQTTRTPTLRWKQHIKDSKKRDCYFHRAINKYG